MPFCRCFWFGWARKFAHKLTQNMPTLNQIGKILLALLIIGGLAFFSMYLSFQKAKQLLQVPPSTPCKITVPLAIGTWKQLLFWIYTLHMYDAMYAKSNIVKCKFVFPQATMYTRDETFEKYFLTTKEDDSVPVTPFTFTLADTFSVLEKQIKLGIFNFELQVPESALIWIYVNEFVDAWMERPRFKKYAQLFKPNAGIMQAAKYLQQQFPTLQAKGTLGLHVRLGEFRDYCEKLHSTLYGFFVELIFSCDPTVDDIMRTIPDHVNAVYLASNLYNESIYNDIFAQVSKKYSVLTSFQLYNALGKANIQDYEHNVDMFGRVEHVLLSQTAFFIGNAFSGYSCTVAGSRNLQSSYIYTYIPWVSISVFHALFIYMATLIMLFFFLRWHCQCAGSLRIFLVSLVFCMVLPVIVINIFTVSKMSNKY